MKLVNNFFKRWLIWWRSLGLKNSFFNWFLVLSCSTLIIILASYLINLYSLIFNEGLRSVTNGDQDKITSLITLMGGLTALMIFWFELKKYQEAQKAKTHNDLARINLKIRILFAKTVPYISEIIERPCLYDYDNRYPFNMPENDLAQTPHQGRSCILVQNALGKFRLQLDRLLPKTTLATAEKVIEVAKQLDSHCKKVLGYLQAKSSPHLDSKAILKNYQEPQAYIQELKAIQHNLESLLETASQ